MDALHGVTRDGLLDERPSGLTSSGLVSAQRLRSPMKTMSSKLETVPFTEEHLKSAVERANKISVMFDRGLKFEYRREADIYQVSVIDTSKDEIVRKIPPDEVVRFIERVKDMFGAMLDLQA